MILQTALVLALSATAPAAEPDCLPCHEDPAAEVAKSVHGSLEAEACAACHGDPHATDPPAVRRATVRTTMVAASARGRPVKARRTNAELLAWIRRRNC